MGLQPVLVVSDSHGRWLNAMRLRAYLGTVLFTFQITVLAIACWEAWRIKGQPGGFDFQTFWAAGRLALDGTPLKAYSWDAIIHAGQQIGPHVVKTGPWRYPPNFLLLMVPFALVSCQIGYPIFATTTTIALIVLLRRVLTAPNTLIWILAFPGLWLNAVQGQNGSLTASLALSAFLLLHKRPVLAGICIGMLSIKPHLAVLFPLALACAGMWRAFAAAAVSAALFTGISVAVFGAAVIPAFLQSMGDASGWLAHGGLPLPQMISIFASLRELHVSITTAYAAQTCEAMLGVAGTIWVWRKSTALELRATALVAATFMVSPYLYNYDAVWLAIPLALLTAQGLRDGWLRWERAILVIVFVYPASGNALGYSPWHIGVGPLVVAALMWIAVRRTYLISHRAQPADQPVT